MSGQGEIFKPDTYRAMSEPFESASDLSEALTEFYADLRELRAKHRIADVLVVVKDAYLHEEGEVPMMSRMNAGNSLNCLPMATWLYAKEQGDHKALLRDLLKQGEDAGS